MEGAGTCLDKDHTGLLLQVMIGGWMGKEGTRELAEINASRRVQSADRQLVVTSSNKVSNKLETKTTGKTSSSADVDAATNASFASSNL